MSGSKRELNASLFRRGAAIIRRNGGFIRAKELAGALASFAWDDAIGRGLTTSERAQMASEVVTSLKANFRMDAYRPVPKVSSTERKSLHINVLTFMRSTPTPSYSDAAARFSVSKSTVARIVQQASVQGTLLQDKDRPFLERLLSQVLPGEGRLLILESTLLERLQAELPDAGQSLDDEIAKLHKAGSRLRLTQVQKPDTFYGNMFVLSRGRNWSEAELQHWAAQTNGRREGQRAPYRLPQLRFVAPHLLVSVSTSSAVRLVCALVTVLADVEDSHAWECFFDLVRRSQYVPVEEYDHKEIAKILSGAFRQGSAEGLQSVASLNRYLLSDLTKGVHKIGTDLLLELETFDGSVMDLLLKLGQSIPFVEDFTDAEFADWLLLDEFLSDVSSPLEAASVLCRTNALDTVYSMYRNPHSRDLSSLGGDETTDLSDTPYIYGNFPQPARRQSSVTAGDSEGRAMVTHKVSRFSDGIQKTEDPRGNAIVRPRQESALTEQPSNRPDGGQDVVLTSEVAHTRKHYSGSNLSVQANGNSEHRSSWRDVPGLFPLPRAEDEMSISGSEDLVDEDGFIYAPEEDDD